MLNTSHLNLIPVDNTQLFNWTPQLSFVNFTQYYLPSCALNISRYYSITLRSAGYLDRGDIGIHDSVIDRFPALPKLRLHRSS